MASDVRPRDLQGRTPHDPGPATSDTGRRARETLQDLDSDAAQLADRLAAPRWYRLLIAGIVALAVLALSAPLLSSAAVVPLIMIWVPFMLTAHPARFSALVSPSSSRRGRRAVLLSLAVLGAIIALAMLLAESSLPAWWGVLTAAAGFGATVLLSRHRDAVVRDEVAPKDLPRHVHARTGADGEHLAPGPAAPRADDPLSSPLQVRLCGMLRSVDEVELAVLREILQVDDAELTQALSPLTEASFVGVRREYSPRPRDPRRLAWASLTDTGRAALASRLATLQAGAEEELEL